MFCTEITNKQPKLFAKISLVAKLPLSPKTFRMSPAKPQIKLLQPHQKTQGLQRKKQESSVGHMTWSHDLSCKMVAHLKRVGVLMSQLVHLLHLLLALLEATEVVLDEEGCIELAHSDVIIPWGNAQ